MAPHAEGGSTSEQIWGGISGARVGRVAIGQRRAAHLEGGGRAEDRRGDPRDGGVEPPRPGAGARREGAPPARTAGVRSSAQFLRGSLLRDIYIARPWDEKLRATRRLLRTLREIWLATLVKEPTARRLRAARSASGLPDLYAIHPRLAAPREVATRVFGIATLARTTCWSGAAALRGRAGAARVGPDARRLQHQQHRLRPPTRIACTSSTSIGAGPATTPQDIGVLLVSNLRNPIQDERLAADSRRLNELVASFAARIREPRRRRPLRDAADAVPGAVVHHLWPRWSRTSSSRGRSSCRAFGCSSGVAARRRRDEDRRHRAPRRVVHGASGRCAPLCRDARSPVVDLSALQSPASGSVGSIYRGVPLEALDGGRGQEDRRHGRGLGGARADQFAAPPREHRGAGS